MKDAAFATQTDDARAPLNIEAEQALLGALLYDNDVYQRVGDFLKPDHFYDPLHARIYESASQLIIAGSLADAVVLRSRFERDPGMAEIGGPVYLADLMREAPDGASAVEYGKLIYDLALRRELIRFGSELVHRAKQSVDDEPATEALSAAQADLGQIEDGGIRGVSLSDPLSGIEDVLAAAERARIEGYDPGLVTGYRDLDRLTGGFYPGDWIVLAGRPSMGKTTVAFDIGGAAASRQLRVGAISEEMTREQLWQRYIVSAASRAGHICDTNSLRRGEWYTTDDRERSMAVAREFAQKVRPYLRVDDRPNLTVQQVAQSLRRMRTDMGGLDLVIIDYLQLLRGDGRRRDGNRVQELSDITKALKALAKDLHVPIITLSQLSRQVEQRENKRPLLSDLRESGSIEQDADVVIFVYREAYYLERNEPPGGTQEHEDWSTDLAEISSAVELIVAKNRQGAIGAARLTLHTASFRLENRI